MCKNNECLVDSLTITRISHSFSEKSNEEKDENKEYFDDLNLTSKTKDPEYILIPKDLMEEYEEYYENLSFEDKLYILLNDTAEVFNPIIDFEEKGAEILRKLIKIKDNPKSEDIRELIKFIED